MAAKNNARKGKVLYTARTRTTYRRGEGIGRSLDGQLDVRLTAAGSGRIGTNPEELIAAGWSTSFATALSLAAQKRKIALDEVAIDAELDLCLARSVDYSLSARFNITLPGVDPAVAQILVQQAEQLCPYCKATRGTIAATFNLVTP